MSSRICFALLALFISSTFGHSQMRCAKYDIATGTCSAPIRNEGQSFDREAHDISEGGVCQFPMSNPISSNYANGVDCGYAPCPLPMGTFQQGENFTIMWLARNHATPDQSPGTIALYLSPVESMNQGSDVTAAVFEQNRFCQAPYASCNGLNGNFVQCYATCQMPTNAAIGIHTIWWKWNWLNHDQVYTNCADINVIAPTGYTPSTPTVLPAPTPVPIPAPSTPSTTASPAPVTTAARVPVTTASPAPVTTAARVPVTTAAPAPVTTASPAPVTTAAPVPVTTASRTTGRASVPSTTGSPAPSTTGSATPSTSSPSTCTVGYQQCVGTSQYRTCSNGRDGLGYWAAPQTCNKDASGNILTCHSSLTANNIYCY